MARPQVSDEEGGIQIRRVAANVGLFNKEVRRSDKGFFFRIGV
jgi:hypothetical protein